MIKREYLYYVASIIWMIPGLILTTKGLIAYTTIPSHQLWLLSITIGVMVFFYTIFTKVVTKYCQYIASQPNQAPIWQVFSTKGWILLLIMVGLGMLIRVLPVAPNQFIASFYTGLGPMLLLSSIRFMLYPIKKLDK